MDEAIKMPMKKVRLTGGIPTGDRGFCSKQRIREWADREAIPEEIAKLQIQEAQSQEVDHSMELVHLILRQVPDELLIAEVQRRGQVIN